MLGRIGSLICYPHYPWWNPISPATPPHHDTYITALKWNSSALGYLELFILVKLKKNQELQKKNHLIINLKIHIVFLSNPVFYQYSWHDVDSQNVFKYHTRQYCGAPLFPQLIPLESILKCPCSKVCRELNFYVLATCRTDCWICLVRLLFCVRT